MKIIPFKSKKKKRKSSKTTITKPKKRKERRCKEALRPSDIKKLKDACETDREKRVITVFLETGMHPAVMADVVKYDMELTRGRLAWDRPKTSKLCTWEYPKNMGKLVDEFTKLDTGFNVITYWRLVKTVAIRAGLGKDVTPLTLRHTATIELLKKKSPNEVMRIIQCSPQLLWGTYGRL